MPRRFPFPVRELHQDNDSALFNELLWKYCRKRRIRMSRSRPYEKNDNAWVEQKNWTHVRKLVGCHRYDTAAEQSLLGELYRAQADLQNFFQAVLKLKEKVRVGVPAPVGIGRADAVGELKARYEALNPAELTAARRGCASGFSRRIGVEWRVRAI
ncbi:MAG: hypothetical protein ABSF98_12615 [Bryobacteraceae bacterium]